MSAFVEDGDTSGAGPVRTAALERACQILAGQAAVLGPLSRASTRAPSAVCRGDSVLADASTTITTTRAPGE